MSPAPEAVIVADKTVSLIVEPCTKSARGSPREPTSSRLGWKGVGCVAWSRTVPRCWSDQRRARYHPASTGRTHIFVVTGRDL